MHTIKVPIWEKRTFLMWNTAAYFLQEATLKSDYLLFIVGNTDEYQFFS